MLHSGNISKKVFGDLRNRPKGIIRLPQLSDFLRKNTKKKNKKKKKKKKKTTGKSAFKATLFEINPNPQDPKITSHLMMYAPNQSKLIHT